MTIQQLAESAKQAAIAMAALESGTKNRALALMAETLISEQEKILEANINKDREKAIKLLDQHILDVMKSY